MSEATTPQVVVLPGGRSPRGEDRIVPRGRHGHPRAEIESIQRARILDAFVEVVGRDGFSGARIADICAVAGVSTKEFYAIFRRKEDCFLAAFDAGATLVCDQGQRAFEKENKPWERRVRSAIHAMLEVLAANPAFARLCIVEVHHVGSEGMGRLNGVIRRCCQTFGGTGPEPPPGLSGEAYEDALVGSVFRPLIEYVVADNAKDLTDLVPMLAYSLALPVVGMERAVRQLYPAGS
jgi:AcrR family transcriptional regulator